MRISIVAALAASFAFSSENVSFETISVTSNSKGYDGVDEAKISTRNATLLNDVFRDIPGVYVGGTNAMNQKIYMRGVSDRGINITIDGAKQNGNTFHHNADLLIDPDLIKAVEVSVGANSVTNGSGTLGGAVAFKTINASDLLEDNESFGAKLKMGYTSNNKGFSQSAILFGQTPQNLEILGAFKHYGYDFSKAGNGKRTGGDGNDISYLFKLGYSFNDAHKISLSTERNQYKGLYPLRAEFGAWQDGQLGYRKYKRETHTFNYDFMPNDDFKLNFNAYNTTHERVDSSKWGVKTSGAKISATQKLTTGDFLHTLKYGTEFYTSKNFSKPNNTTPEKVNNYSAYLEDAIKYGNFTLTPGIRYEIHELKSYDGKAGSLKSIKYKFKEFSPALALDYEIGRGFGAFASYAKVFRGPDVIESMLASGSGRAGAYNWAKNGDLKATTGDSYEFGGRFKNQISENSSLSLIAKYFRTEYENLIVDNNANAGVVGCPNGANTLCRVNSGGAVIDGVELLAKATLDALSLSASYTHQKVKYKDRVAVTGRNGTRYLSSNLIGYRDQGDKYALNAEYSLPRADLLLGYNLLFFKSKNTISANDFNAKHVKMPSYAVSDIYATYIPSGGRLKGLEINAGVYNLFNKAYASHSQRTAEYSGDTNTIDWESGRNFKVSFAYKF
ncbi:TonB-dependent receptor domain-containing protein [Campylobacter gastrosuis]|uniref:TonB-dependent receptor n=1 Tax=Campylobacter gastrosuis TaxID=2974576 RepID=A0ABT7HLR9_9BACT|nr:TonB-dependent receptor [Campylobacter gastrosuis]MDL0087914.1 TonB-dependent receptor [Campylobacter gastrosuis]